MKKWAMRLSTMLALAALIAGSNAGAADQAPVARADAEDYMQGFARCVVMGNPAKARAILAAPADSAEEQALLMQVAKARSRCLNRNGKLKMQGYRLRGAIAGQLYLRTFPAPLTDAAHPDAPIPPVDGFVPLQAYATCVAARDAASADQIVRADLHTEASGQAFGRAMPALSSCLDVEEGRQMVIDRAVLRGFLAEALYRQRMADDKG